MRRKDEQFAESLLIIAGEAWSSGRRRRLSARGLRDGLVAEPFGSAKATSDIAKDEPAEALYNDALARLQNKNFDGAARKFQELDKQYPYTSWSRRSLLLQTYANYEQRNYEDAIQTGRRYVQLYPADKDAAYAQYLVGMSYFNQIRTPRATRSAPPARCSRWTS